VTVLVAGNIARCGDPNTSATSSLIDTLPGTILTAGDNAFPSGNTQEYMNCYDPTWGTQKARTWAALGNHDYDSGYATPALNYFGSHAGTNGLGYYSMDLGDWHIIVLNDNQQYVDFTAGTTQEQWLRADLAANSKTCTMAIWHQPLFLSSSTAGFTQRSVAKILWDDLYAAGADVVVNGHQHDYERMKPMRPDGSVDTVQGIRQFNVGTGGDSQAMPDVINPNSAALAVGYGVLRLTLRASDYDWQFVSAAGTTINDAGTGSCH
jgi:hypothetical protein